MRIIWLSGWAGAGKDTIAAILCKKYDYQRIAFADSLKDIVAKKYKFSRSLCDTPEGKASTIESVGRTVREILIRDSAEAKEVNVNVFAEHALEKILASKQKKIVISDWRFPHEIAFIMSQLLDFDHIQIRITRPDLLALADPSEHALDDWVFDKQIINNDLRNLEKDVVNFVAFFK
jgi:thymidylate kinase